MNNSLIHPRSTVENFREWLNTEIAADFELTNIGVENTIVHTRGEILEAAKAIVKHTSTRFWGVLEDESCSLPIRPR